MTDTYPILIIFSLGITILVICKNRNAWDILFFNSTLAIVTLFVIGFIAHDIIVWRIVAGSLGAVATGEIIIRYFKK